MKGWKAYSTGSKTGILGAVLGILAAGILWFVSLAQYSMTSNEGTVTGWAPAGIGYLLGQPGADPAFFYWGVVVLVLALVGGYGAITARRTLVLVVSSILLVVSLLGILSIGVFIAPAALMFFLSGLWLDSTVDSVPARVSASR